LQQIADGSEEAFGMLFHTWRNKLYFFILRLSDSPEVAEDVLQDVFIKLWINRATLKSVDHFSAYLYRMAQNHVINHARRMALENSILEELQKGSHATEQTILTKLAHKQLQETIEATINNLPPQQKLVYTLARVQGFKQEEIALQLQISVSTVKNHMTQALKTIRKQLRDQYPTIGLYLLASFLHHS
jgi:RNA polymerase sigma-70 factor (ECF subfamily)